MTRFILAFFSILTVLTFIPTVFASEAQEFSDAQKAELNKLFEEYLMGNGSVILQSVNTYQAKLAENDRIEASKKAEGFLNDIKDKKDLPMAGNPDGDITIVEFFDYNCGYCRKALSEIQTVLKDDKDVKIIFMDMPILGPASLEASKWSLAAHKQGKYFEYHQAIMEHNGQKDEASLEKLAKKVGLDIEQLKKDKADDAIAATLQDHVEQAQGIGVTGTPGFIIAGQLFPGFAPADQIKETIANARKK